MLKSQNQINFGQFDFDNFTMSNFQATETQFKPKSIDLFIHAAFVQKLLTVCGLPTVSIS